MLEFLSQISMKSRLASHSPAKFLVFFMLLYLASHSRLEAQLKPGQYLEESPLGSWNQFGIDSAATLGTGLSQLTLSRNNQIILSNPALLSSLK